MLHRNTLNVMFMFSIISFYSIKGIFFMHYTKLNSRYELDVKRLIIQHQEIVCVSSSKQTNDHIFSKDTS